MHEKICQKYSLQPITSATNLSQKIALLRVDLNVPFDENNIIQDDSRIRAILPTVEYLLQNGAYIVLISHLGDPKSEDDKEKLSLSKILSRLSEITDADVLFCPSHKPEDIISSVQHLKQHQTNRKILLVENLRFSEGEKTNDAEFAKLICTAAELYVNDAFSASHRFHSSIVGIPGILGRQNCYAGINMMYELEMLEKTFCSFDSSSSIAIIGGKKVSTKLPLLKSLANCVGEICIVGGMANTFLYASGCNMGSSFYEPNMVAEAKKLMECKSIVLPKDIVCQNQNSNCSIKRVVKDHCNDEEKVCDIGPATSTFLHDAIGKSKFILWNGPAGIYEETKFSIGTDNIARSIAYHTRYSDLTSIIGGGDTVAVLNKLKLSHDNFSYISNAGGAFLTWIGEKTLCGITALQQTKS